MTSDPPVSAQDRRRNVRIDEDSDSDDEVRVIGVIENHTVPPEGMRQRGGGVRPVGTENRHRGRAVSHSSPEASDDDTHADDSEDEIVHRVERLPTTVARSVAPPRGVKRKATGTLEKAGPSKKTHLVLECPVCKLSLQEKKIVATECGHLICHGCMQTILNGGFVHVCPKCRKTIKRNSVRNIYF